jgi:hypothetical protein
MRKGPQLAILSIMVLMAVMALLSTGDSADVPDDRVLCDDCHDDFEPFVVDLDIPTEVPEDEEFDLSLTVNNEGDHTVQSLVVEILSNTPENIIVAEGQNTIVEFPIDGTLGFRQQTGWDVLVAEVHREIRFDLSGSGGIRDTLLLEVIAPDGTTWSSGGSGMTGSITLAEEDFENHGYGNYEVFVTHNQGVRSVPYDLLITMEYGPDYAYEVGSDLSRDDSQTFTFRMLGFSKGSGEILISVRAVAYHEHTGQGDDYQSFTWDDTVVIEVGDEFVDAAGDDGSSGRRASLLAAGQALGFISALLLAGSLVTSGNLPRLPKRGKVHCYLSYGLTGIFLIHWLTLWAGPYGSTAGGIGTGSVMMALILVLALTGVRPKLLEGKVMGWSNRLLHRNLTYSLVGVLVVHMLLNGSHFAVLRGG